MQRSSCDQFRENDDEKKEITILFDMIKRVQNYNMYLK